MSDKFQGGVLAGSVDISLPVLLLAVADNTGKTGSVAAYMTLSYWRQGGLRVAVSATNLAAVNSAHSDGGVKEVDSTNMPGHYRIDWPDAAFAAGADWVTLTVLATDTFGCSGCLPITTNVVQTGDSFARVGAAGAGLTALGDTRIANLDATVSSRLSTAGYTAPPAAATIAAAVWAVVIDGTRTAAQLVRGFTAALLGKASGLETANAKYRDIADTKDVISATVTADGNRSSVTLDLT